MELDNNYTLNLLKNYKSSHIIEILKKTPKIYEDFENRCVYHTKMFTQIPYDIIKIDNDNTIYYKLILENNTLFNNLRISISNPNNLPINDLVNKISIEINDIEFYCLEDDLSTHINVLKNFLDISLKYNTKTLSSEITFGLIDLKSIISIQNTTTNYIKLKGNFNLFTKIEFYANLYTIKSLNNTDIHLDNYQQNNSQEKNYQQNYHKMFRMLEIYTQKNVLYNNVFLYRPVSAIYLSNINYKLIKEVCLEFKTDYNCNYGYQNKLVYLKYTIEELINLNKIKYGIDTTNQIVFIFEPNILTSYNNLVDLSYFDFIKIKVSTINNEPITFNVNTLGINLYTVYSGKYMFMWKRFY